MVTGDAGIPGYATAEGTARYRSRHPAAGYYRELDGLALSSLGLGTYLGKEDDATDRAYEGAVRRAFQRSINVIDAAVNYRNQRSERAVGRALAAAIAAGEVARDEVVLATKGGFLPFDGSVPADPKRYLLDTYVRPGILTARDVVGGCHCMTPRYLADQLERSRANLGVQTIDVYYVHNPEMQLSEVDRPTFLERMRAAFAALESAVADGVIRRYGTATWTGYRQAPDATDHLSLAELVALAREVGGADHHFRVIQVPFNLGMAEAFTHANQPVGDEGTSVLEAARRLGIYVMTSASVYQGKLTARLPAAIGEVLPGLASDAQRAIQFARSAPGVGTALVGMSRPAHVDDNAGVASRPPLEAAAFSQLFSGG
jgi:aryl-alcohol dehydrogenase-like predicted oxidoreductase